MKLNPLTTTHLRQYSSAIYAVKELIQSQKVDGYDYMIDTLMMAFYGIDSIIDDLEIQEREERIKRAQEYQKKCS